MVTIKVENLSKIYRLGEIGTGTISRDMERWFKTKVLKQEDSFLKIGESNDRSKKGSSDIVYSLKDISFEIEQGDTVGIIGRNGAGKSTLLKILSRVTTPTTGKINIKGRVASLLEVGTGFHPELTGRENIYLNGAILGMRKREIDRKLDEIIDFSGIERYIDTPVKRYSSGMYVRLAFAVAAHLESEILIVDEVLAVGDAEFQKKCLGKMGEVSKGEGRTVLFVSHNMGAVAQLCEKCMLIEKGQNNIFDFHRKVIDFYMFKNKEFVKSFEVSDNKKNKEFYIKSVETFNEQMMSTDTFPNDECIMLKLKLYSFIYRPKAEISVTLQNINGEFLSTFVESLSEMNLEIGQSDILFKFQRNIIAPNSYFFRVALFVPNSYIYDLVEMICPINVIDVGSKMAMFEGINYGYFFIDHKMTLIR
jgi:lipopolysaccharide transport system ATP-binding protein